MLKKNKKNSSDSFVYFYPWSNFSSQTIAQYSKVAKKFVFEFENRALNNNLVDFPYKEFFMRFVTARKLFSGIVKDPGDSILGTKLENRLAYDVTEYRCVTPTPKIIFKKKNLLISRERNVRNSDWGWFYYGDVESEVLEQQPSLACVMSCNFMLT